MQRTFMSIIAVALRTSNNAAAANITFKLSNGVWQCCAHTLTEKNEGIKNFFGNGPTADHAAHDLLHSLVKQVSERYQEDKKALETANLVIANFKAANPTEAA